ncbi:hypothetical protein ACHAW5_007769 [Stephanodiscus triporus]|uniref:Uncharacterized protein n=1 Tax=Stephanodiscus triporus TaxID=2934178 RepID=A0ABD3MQ85_9STRA
MSKEDDRLAVPPRGIMEGAHPSLSGRRAGEGNGAYRGADALALDWSSVPPHLRGYYSKLYGTYGGVRSSPSTAARQEAGGQPTTMTQRQQLKELERQPRNQQRSARLGVVELKRQQALKRDAGEMGGDGATTTVAVAVAAGNVREQPPPAGKAAEEKETEAEAISQARAAYEAHPPLPSPAVAAIKMPIKEEIAMVRPAEEKMADAAQHQPLVSELEMDGINQG